MAGSNYGTVDVPDIPGGQGVIGISLGAVGFMPVSCIVDDPTVTSNQSPARVMSTAPAGTELGLVIRNANDGAAGTGLNPPTGGSGYLGFLSVLARLIFGGGSELIVSHGGTTTTAIAAGHTGNTTVKPSAGRLCQVLVTASGTNAMQFTDGASGTVIGLIPASAPVNGVPYIFNMPVATSIIAVGNANNPAVTVAWL